MDALAQRVERGGHDLAVEDEAPGRERGRDLGEVTRERLAIARLKLDLAVVDEGHAAKAVVLDLVGPALAVRQRLARTGELRQDGWLQRQRHWAAPWPAAGPRRREPARRRRAVRGRAARRRAPSPARPSRPARSTTRCSRWRRRPAPAQAGRC